MAFVIGAIIFFRLHAFLALLGGAFVVAYFTSKDAILSYAVSKGMTEAAANQLATTDIGIRIATEFGRTCGKIGILIAMASIIGKCLLESGGAERIVRSSLKVSGEKKAPLTFLGSSFFIGIPVFFDTVFYLMVPLAKAMAMKIKKHYLLLILAICAGAAMANSLVPPTPGPLFLVGEMNIPIGHMMIGGILVGIVTIIAGYLYAVWCDKRWPITLRDSLDAKLEELDSWSQKGDEHLPPLWFSLLPILIPIVFISMNALMQTMFPDSNTGLFSTAIAFFGEKNMALVGGAIASLLLLVMQRKGDSKALKEAVQAAIMSAGVIILITSAGGAFGGMLQQTGIGPKISEMTAGYQSALIPLAFLITAVVRTAQGSATVAMITASGLLAGLATSNSLEFHPVYLGLAIACGSKLIPWMNDSGFWIVCKMSDLTEKELLRTFSPMLTIMGVVGLFTIMLAAALFPLV